MGGLRGALVVVLGLAGPLQAAGSQDAPVCIQGESGELSMTSGDCPDLAGGTTPGERTLKRMPSQKPTSGAGAKAGSGGRSDSDDPPTRFDGSAPKSMTSALEQIALGPDERVSLAQFEALVSRGTGIVPDLVAVFRDGEVDTRARWVAARALGRLPHPLGTDALYDGLKSGNAMVKMASIKALQDQKDPGARQAMLRALDDKGAMVRTAALDALADLGTQADVPRVARELTSSHNFYKGQGLFVRSHAATTLAQLGGDEAIRALVSVVDDKDPELRGAANEGLMRLTGLNGIPPGTGSERERWQAFLANR